MGLASLAYFTIAGYFVFVTYVLFPAQVYRGSLAEYYVACLVVLGCWRSEFRSFSLALRIVVCSRHHPAVACTYMFSSSLILDCTTAEILYGSTSSRLTKIPGLHNCGRTCRHVLSKSTLACHTGAPVQVA